MRIGNLVLQWIRIPKPLKKLKLMSGNNVKNIIGSSNPKAQVFIADGKYKIFKTKDLMPVFATHRFNEMPYIKDYRDCDDYSWSFIGQMKKLIPGCTIGKVWANYLDSNGKIDFKHDFCFFIDERDQLMFIEPQTNKIFTPRRNIRPYLFIT